MIQYIKLLTVLWRYAYSWVTFTKQLKNGETLTHQARVITYADEGKHKLISLLTNDMESDPSEIIAIYRKRWEIELLFKQMK